MDVTLSTWSLSAITVMRILVGWHFFYEGLGKVTAESWSAAGYLRQARGPFAETFRWIASQPNLLANADTVTMWGLTLVGLCLILGLFTRTASAAGAILIVLFYLAAPPFIGYHYSLPSEGSYLVVNKNLVELGALAVIFTTRTGHFAGLDRILNGLFVRRRPLAAA
jgi:thiosulfate dehydrogenase [quinone] large subunit